MPADSSRVFSDLAELRECWYSIAKLYEGLRRYKSAKDAGFSNSLDSIFSGIESFERLLEDFYGSISSIFPVRPQKLELRKNEILEEVANFRGRVFADRAMVASLREKNLRTLKAKLKKVQEGYEALERDTTEKCNRYFERKREYTIAREKIEGAVGKRIGAVRDVFAKKVSEITEGGKILMQEREITVDELFDSLVGEHADVNLDEIHIRTPDRGGIIDTITGGASKRESAKESVLKYEAHEIIQRAIPLKKKEAELIAKLGHKFNDLKGLEDECNRAEEKREAALKERDRLRMEREASDAPERLREAYAHMFDEVTPRVESFVMLTKNILEKKAESSEDREALAKIDERREELYSIEKEMEELDEKLSKEELLEYKGKLEELKSLIRKLEGELDRRIDEMSG